MQNAPKLLNEVSIPIPGTFIAGTVLDTYVEIPSCDTPFVEVESQDIAISWLANPWSESVLAGRRAGIPPGIADYRWSADTGPAGSRARFPAVRANAIVGVTCVLQQGYNNAVDPSNGRTLQGVAPTARAVVRVWDSDPIWWQYFADSPTLFGAPTGYNLCGQVGAVSTVTYGYAPGYCRFFVGYGATGTSWLIYAPDGSGPVSSVTGGNNRISGGIHPACEIRISNNNAFPSQGSLTWTTQPVAI